MISLENTSLLLGQIYTYLENLGGCHQSQADAFRHAAGVASSKGIRFCNLQQVDLTLDAQQPFS